MDVKTFYAVGVQWGVCLVPICKQYRRNLLQRWWLLEKPVEKQNKDQ